MPSSSPNRFCPGCKRLVNDRAAFCPHCRATLNPPPARSDADVALLLAELGRHPMRTVLTQQQRSRLAGHYQAEARELRSPTPPEAPEPERAPVLAATPSVADAAIGGVAPTPADSTALRRAPVPRQRSPKPSAREFDWNWLAEQQANLFLFAGAFLTVVAALIYVGYSAQAVSGVLKMTLLSAYTGAFLVAGLLCMRMPRVELAGRVFFGVGAVLLPMNFVAARNIFAGDELSTEALWLTGSIVTAAFYAAVASLGIGRMYAFGAGSALVSATLAGVIVSDMPVEWAPLCFLALAIAMAVAGIVSPAVFRERVASAWVQQAHVVAVAALGVAIAVAPFADADFDVASRWFLPLSFAMFAAYAAIPMLLTRAPVAGVAAIAGASGAFASCVYAFEMPSEAYAVAFGALSVVLGLAMLVTDKDAAKARLPVDFTDALRYAAMAATGLSALAAYAVLEAATGTDATYVVHTRWFVAASFALILAYYAFDAVAHARREAVFGAAVAAFGVGLAVVYGLDVSVEYYAFGLIAPALAITLLAGAPAAWTGRLAATWRADLMLMARAAAAFGCTFAAYVAIASAADNGVLAPDSRIFLPIAFAVTAVLFAIDAGRKSEAGTVGLMLALTGAATGAVYAARLSPEYHAFALIAPSLAAGAVARWLPEARATRLHASWRVSVFSLGEVAVMGSAGFAIAAAFVGAEPSTDYQPVYRAFLPVVLACSAAFLALDASRAPSRGTSLALFAALTAMFVGVPYAFDAEAAYYGMAFVAAGLLFGLSGRAESPSWIDAGARDASAVAAVTIGWLAFEGAYVDALRLGAVVHFAAAAFYAAAALGDRSPRTLRPYIDTPGIASVRLAMGWVYAAALTASISFVMMLRSMTDAADAGSELLAAPLMGLAVVFAVAGVAARGRFREFAPHMYVISLFVVLAAIVASPGAGMLTLLLLAAVALYALIAVYEDQPLIAAASVAFGFAAVAAWREYAGADIASIPVAYAVTGVALYALSAALRMQTAESLWLPVSSRAGRWAQALAAGGALFAIVAPLAGFYLLQERNVGGFVGTTPLRETALYQASTIALAVVAALVLAESYFASKRWLIVPASAIALVALLLQIGVYSPENPQAYAVPIGVYLLLLGLLGLWKFRLMPELAEAAPAAEALGAAVIMGPTLLQSLEYGWHYQVIALTEAALFFTLAIVLRRRALLGAAIVAMVLIAGRVLFDTVNALPNWVVVAIAGFVLLGVGSSILAGRDRWSRWEESLLGWWNAAADGRA